MTFHDLGLRQVLVPILGKRVPVIADDYVQMDFGSGALKITPAHDVNDYAIGKRPRGSHSAQLPTASSAQPVPTDRSALYCFARQAA